MTTATYLILPPEVDDTSLVQYKCMQDSCVNRQVILTSDQLDAHTVYIHNCDYISLETTDRSKNDTEFMDGGSPEFIEEQEPDV